MADSQQGTLHGLAEGIVAGSHLPRNTLRILAGPATGDEFNTIQFAIFPIACFKLEDVNFEFDSSVIGIQLATGIHLLKSLISEHTQFSNSPDGSDIPPPISVFGHADPVGDDDYNKSLSGRRAASVYGMLTRRPEIWEDLYSNGGKFALLGATGDQWGLRSIQTMLNGLPADPAVSPPPDPLEVDGISGPKTTAAIKQFQKRNGLGVDGVAGPATRKKLFLTYMDQICVDLDGKPFQIDPVNGFLGRNTHPLGKGDFQGCSEFNPLLLFSQEKLDQFNSDPDKTARNGENEINRRVMILLFRPGAKVSPTYWPCPLASEGKAGCVDRFWSDGEKRRTNGLEQREFNKTKDTFACRFYQRLLQTSPCEIAPQGMGFLVVRIFFLARVMSGLSVTFSTLDDGEVGEPLGPDVLSDDNGVARLLKPVPVGNYACTIQEQLPQAICTVREISNPEIIVLPVGRPYLNIDGDQDFIPSDNSTPPEPTSP